MSRSPAAVDPEAAYYQTVEEFFVSRRGDPLFLSSADWVLVHGWRRSGLPLRVVLRGIADALDSHAHSWGRQRKVGSLRFCAAEVGVARERWERALALGREEGADVAGSLLRFASDLDEARGLGPAAAAAAAALARELRGRASSAEAREIEPWLGAREVDLLEAIQRDEDPQTLARLVAEVDAALASYQARMPERVLSQVRAHSLARRLLDGHGLPRLSLFL